MTRETSPNPQYTMETRTAQETSITNTLEQQMDGQPGTSDLSFLDEDFLPWQSGDMEWNQPVLPGTSMAIDGLPVPSASTIIANDQHGMNTFADSFPSTTRWHALNEYDNVYRQP